VLVQQKQRQRIYDINIKSIILELISDYTVIMYAILWRSYWFSLLSNASTTATKAYRPKHV